MDKMWRLKEVGQAKHADIMYCCMCKIVNTLWKLLDVKTEHQFQLTSRKPFVQNVFVLDPLYKKKKNMKRIKINRSFKILIFHVLIFLKRMERYVNAFFNCFNGRNHTNRVLNGNTTVAGCFLLLLRSKASVHSTRKLNLVLIYGYPEFIKFI